MEIILSRDFAQKRKQFLDDDHFHSLLRVFSVNPEYGMPLSNSDGLRRARWDFCLLPDCGGVKIIYCWHAPTSKLFLLSIFPKEDQDNVNCMQAKELTEAVLKVFRYGK